MYHHLILHARVINTNMRWSSPTKTMGWTHDEPEETSCAIRNLVFPWVPLNKFYSALHANFNGWPLTETGKDHFTSPPCLLDLRIFLPSKSSMQAARLDYSTLNPNATTCTTKPTMMGLPTTTITTAAVAYVALRVKWKWRSPSCSTGGTTSHCPWPRCPRSSKELQKSVHRTIWL